MRNYLKSFHESLQDLNVNTYVELGFCMDKTIRNDLRQRLISMLNRHSQIFIMVMTVRLPEAYADAECDRLFSSFLTDFISNERDCYGNVEFVWRFERENAHIKDTGLDGHGQWRLVLFYSGDAHGSTSHRKHAEKYWAKTLDIDTASGLIHISKPQSKLSYLHDGFKLRRGDAELDKVRNDCFSWISYIAKVRKNILAEKNKSYGCSQL